MRSKSKSPIERLRSQVRAETEGHWAKSRVADVPGPMMLEREVALWNRLFPIGTPVKVRRDDGSELATKTRSEAWVLGGHTAVVKVDGFTGGYLLERVTPQVRGDGTCAT